MDINKTELVSYTKGEELLNTLTHIMGIKLPVFILIGCLPHANNSFSRIAAILYAVGTAMTFIASAIYHGLPEGRAKKLFRIIDHTAIFFAVAGTVTGCTPSVFRLGITTGAILMLVIAWTGVIAGLVLTVFYFHRFKGLRMGLYIGSSALSALLGAESYLYLPIGAFLTLIFGSIALLSGCLFLRAGKKIPYMHSIFHIFVVVGLGIYCYGIYKYVFLLL